MVISRDFFCTLSRLCIASLEFNVNYYLVGLYTDRNFEMAKLNIDKIFFNYKNDVFKKIKENLTNENER